MAHCDLKPENIMLSDTDPGTGQPVAKLIDFGTAQMLTRNSDGTADDSADVKHVGTAVKEQTMPAAHLGRPPWPQGRACGAVAAASQQAQ